jgi:hypothetical protein
MKTAQIGSITYSIKLLDRSRVRKNTDLCPVCKNGMGCDYSFVHGRQWT